MRRTLEAIALLALVVTWGITCQALLGPSHLSGAIAIHFDASGRPNGWGESYSLWFLPGLASFIYLTMTVVARSLAASIYPTPEIADSRTRILSLTISVLLWAKIEIICFFIWIQFQMIRGARQGHLTISPHLLLVVLTVIFGTIGWSMVSSGVSMWQSARARLS